MRRRTASKAALLLLPLLLAGSLPPLAAQSSSNVMQQLTNLESTYSTAWTKYDKTTFQADTTSVMVRVPQALFGIGSEVTTALRTTAKVASKVLTALEIVSPIFSIFSIIADAIGMTIFSEEQQFAELYNFLQDNFIQVNAMIESNFHAIKDVESLIQCDIVSRDLRSYKNQVGAFFERFVVVMNRARTDRAGAMALFDTELAQYPSSTVLLNLRHLLVDRSVYVGIINYCTRGNVVLYVNITVELQHTFMKAILLDRITKIRVSHLTKKVLETDRAYWKDQVTQVTTLMQSVGNNLITQGWYSFFTSDVDRSLSNTAGKTASNAAGVLASDLEPKYLFIRTAIIVIPFDAKSITITDASGASMSTVSQDSFICYNNHRSGGDTVIVFCRNRFNYPDEQAELNNAFATYSRGVLSLSLTDALANNRFDEIGAIMTKNRVSFFAVKVEVSLSSGSVSTAQTGQAANLVFFQGDGSAFQALVTAKLITFPTPNPPPSVAVLPKKVKSAARARAQWHLVALCSAAVGLRMRSCLMP